MAKKSTPKKAAAARAKPKAAKTKVERKAPKKEAAAGPKAEEQARAAEWREFAKIDYPKILKAQNSFDPRNKEELRHGEGLAFYNFLTLKKNIDAADILLALLNILELGYPKALEAWQRDIKDWAIERGYCKWAKKHPKAAADLF